MKLQTKRFKENASCQYLILARQRLKMILDQTEEPDYTLVSTIHEIDGYLTLHAPTDVVH